MLICWNISERTRKLMFMFHLRSLFVPNFKHLLDGCVRHLMDAEGAESTLKHKKKKVKLQESNSKKKDTNCGLSIGLWHLRALILSSLHKSFLYDTGTLKFLDSANFQASCTSHTFSLLICIFEKLTIIIHLLFDR